MSLVMPKGKKIIDDLDAMLATVNCTRQAHVQIQNCIQTARSRLANSEYDNQPNTPPKEPQKPTN